MPLRKDLSRSLGCRCPACRAKRIPVVGEVNADGAVAFSAPLPPMQPIDPLPSIPRICIGCGAPEGQCGHSPELLREAT